MPTSTPRERHVLNVLEAIAEAGMALLASGAEAFRVEDTMQRLAQSYAIHPVEVMVLPTGLFLHGPDGITLVRRIHRRSVNLAVLAAINQISRDVAEHPIPLEELSRRVETAKTFRRYPRWMHLGFAAVGAAILSQLMGGQPADALPALLSGALAQWVRQGRFGTRVVGGISDLLAALLAVLPALGAASLGWPHPGAIVVGGIMVLTPGLLMTTAVRDGIQGDLLSAAARMLEAMLSAGAIAAGASLPLYLYLALGGRWTS
jgi:uncharacterized membrane protein YjjP (DUF1212 family)